MSNEKKRKFESIDFEKKENTSKNKKLEHFQSEINKCESILIKRVFDTIESNDDIKKKIDKIIETEEIKYEKEMKHCVRCHDNFNPYQGSTCIIEHSGKLKSTEGDSDVMNYRYSGCKCEDTVHFFEPEYNDPIKYCFEGNHITMERLFNGPDDHDLLEEDLRGDNFHPSDKFAQYWLDKYGDYHENCDACEDIVLHEVFKKYNEKK